MWRRVIWTIVALAAAYIVMLMVTTPTPPPDHSGHEPGMLGRVLPGSWSI